MEYDLQTFRNILNPDDSTTGGGSASAIAGAMAASLAAMVCRLSLKGLEDEQAFLEQAAAECRELSGRLMPGAQADMLAFQAVSQAFRLPKDSDEQRAERSRAIQAAWTQAARVPLENAGLCLRVCQIAAGLRGRINPNTASDLNCALLLARAGTLGCLENVAINLPSIKDETAAAALAEQAARIRRDLDALGPLP